MSFKKLMLYILVLLLLFTGCAKSANTENLNEKLELAVKYLSENNFEEAILAYKEVIEIDNKNIKAYQGLGKIYELQGNYDEASRVYNEGIKNNNDDSNTNIRLALAGMYFNNGDMKLAEQIYKEIIAKQKNIIDAYYCLALVYQWNGEHDKAQGVLDQLVSNNSKDYRAYNATAQYYYSTDERQKGLAMIAESLALEPNQCEAYTILKGMYDNHWDELFEEGLAFEKVKPLFDFYAYFASEQYSDAIDVYNNVIKQDTNNQKNAILAAISMFKNNDKEQADQLINKIKAEQNSCLMTAMANYYLLVENKEQAIKWAYKSLQLDENNFEAIKILCQINADKDDKLINVYLTKLQVYSWLPQYVFEEKISASGLSSPLHLSEESNDNVAKNNTNVFLFVDGEEVISEEPLVNLWGTSCIPAATLAKALKLPYEWDDANMTGIIGTPPQHLEPSYLGNVYINGMNIMKLDTSNSSMSCFGFADTAYVHVSVLESLGHKVSWNERAQSIIIGKPPVPKLISEKIALLSEYDAANWVGRPLVEKDVSLSKIKMGSSESQVVKKLGQPTSVEGPTLGLYMSKTIHYPGLELYATEGMAGEYSLERIAITSAEYPTIRGVKVGDSFKKVKELYGTNFYQWVDHRQRDCYSYYIPTPYYFNFSVNFIIEDNVVKEIVLNCMVTS